ncbi:hypothetical protein QCA50_000434 [Cerrena zonata]|uniref:Uncharacterized protein n=1 Tax=Cerrena zonata TaxID=2478898 RepID=A0AAW0GQM7_9APHY
MKDSYTRPPRSSRKDRQISRSQSTRSARPARHTNNSKSIFRLRMPTKFNIARACIYAAVLVWTIICLAIAVHFQQILVSSDLTRFIPFAIFVCSASLLLMIALLGFGLWRERNPVSARVELGCLALAGVLWLALGAFLGSSESEGADVECFSSSDSSQPFDMPGFNTDTYRSQYRVLEAFSIFNIILIWGFLLTLLALAIRKHRGGDRSVWIASVTSYPWFGGKDKQLPPPATARRTRSGRSQTRGGPRLPEKEELPTPPRRHGSTRQPPTRNEAPTYVHWIPHKTPDPAQMAVARTKPIPRDKYFRDASPRR